MSDSTDPKTRLIAAALMHVPFDGWSETSFRAAAADAGLTLPEARALCPRGAVDLALAFHAQGDAAMLVRLAQSDLGALRYSDRVAFAIRTRLELVEHDKEAVRRGVTLFALPLHAADGAKALWQTADAIWTALGDTSDDLNWYTKRATLSGVYSATVLYWLGDQSMGHGASWAFLDRRIDDVMQIERAKKALRDSKILGPLMAGPDWLAARIKAPGAAPADLPGRWRR
ncbi:COQ9 family protein [uncultured Roseicyclus sp.]|jgi:ubiquinone biosynthesis protein COQ9|uniref:COQ9 family protein n=1 Tax=uncultured Roseicyclus sp. TaxID=543072 RepID=UPI002622E447|nr:COQ9 family protein [uncultured Roseicyclus sp.]